MGSAFQVQPGTNKLRGPETLPAPLWPLFTPMEGERVARMPPQIAFRFSPQLNSMAAACALSHHVVNILSVISWFF